MRKYITAEEAISLLPDKDSIHTFYKFYNVMSTLFGADWSRADVIKELNKPGMVIEIAGELARGMDHGIAAYPKDAKRQSEVLFIETDKEKLDIFDAEEKQE